MAKIKKVFACTSCGNTSSKWEGKCPACGEWNTYTEEIISKTPNTNEEKKKVWTSKTAQEANAFTKNRNGKNTTLRNT
jgi:DNA repair protein RadA/Sms